MVSLDGISAVPGGLEGDRYCTGRGFYSPFDVCEVTFVQAESLGAIRAEAGIDLQDGRHRRNVVVRGGDVHELLEHRFEIGAATFEGTRPRPPCRHVEEVAGESGVMRALGNGRGGVCARVIRPGRFEVGDTISVTKTLNDFDGLVESIRERAGE